MPTYVGTAHFISMRAAVAYYAPYGLDRKEVLAKMVDGDFKLSKPALKEGEKLLINSEGRYVVEVEK